jgi:hypothetical protein
LSGYSPRRPLLGAFINGASAQILTVMLRRDEVVRRSQGLQPSVRSKLLDDWDAMAEAARLYKERQAENMGEVPVAPPALAAAAEDVEGGLYSVRMIASVIGRSDRRVRQMLVSGDLEGVKVHDRWMVTEESVGDYGMRQLLARQAG